MISDQLTRLPYDRLLDELTVKTGSSKAKASAVLATTSCETFATHSLENKGSRTDTRFDPYYLMKHEGAKLKLIDRLKSALAAAGVEFQLLTEENGTLGRYDVVIITEGKKLKIQGGHRTIVVEIKASLGLDLAQVERYLLGGEPVLLVRIMTGQVTLLSPDDHAAFLSESVKDLAGKAQRILNNRPVLVPGYECRQCPVMSCPFNKYAKKPDRELVCMKPEEFDADLARFLRNLYPTVEKAVGIIFSELSINEVTSSSRRA
jgi:hypothetical protein